MSADLVVLDGKSKMAEFHEKLKDKLRGHIAEMIPDEVVAEMAKQVVQEEFFKDIPARKDNYGREYEAAAPSQFKQMVFKAAEPFIKEQVEKFMVEHKDEIAKAAIEAVSQRFAASLVSAFMSTAGALNNITMKLEQMGWRG